MADKLDETLDELKTELDQPVPESATPAPSNKSVKKKGAKKVATKAKKTAAKKVAKKSEVKTEGEKVTLQDLATEAKITTQRARQKLRAAEVERDGRWSWDKGSRALQAARKALDLK